MSPLPPEFVGLWNRVSIVVDGCSIPGAGPAWWFQAPQRFLDVRARGGGLRAEMFGGVTTWSATARTLFWSHDLDLHDDGSDDSGRVEWIHGDLVEHGTAASADGVVEYTEVWRRHTADDVVTIADRVDATGRLARCGSMGAVFIDDRPDGPIAGGCFVDRGTRYEFEVTHGLPLTDTPSAMPHTGTFEQFGQTWTVVSPRRSSR